MTNETYNVTERVTIVASTLLRADHPIPLARIAVKVGITHSGAWSMLCKMSAVLPITYDSRGWFVVSDD